MGGRARSALLWPLAWGWLVAAAAVGRRVPANRSVMSVEPARAHGLLVCRLTAAGLPGERLLSTLHSGLASAVDLDLALLDAQGRVLAGNLVRLRLAFDLWQEEFTVSHGDEAVRLPDDAALTAWLAAPPWLPVAPLAAIVGAEPHRIRAVLRLHAIAPEARERAAALVAGPEGQEVSMGLGSLIRGFYRRRRRRRPARRAPPFRLRSAERI